MKKYIALLLSIALLITCLPGCGAKEEGPYVPTGDALLMEGQDPEDLLPPEEDTQELTLAYNPEKSLNPLIGYSQNNRVLFSLIYQSLFVTDNKGVSYPMLCSSYRVTPDNMTWTIYVDTNAQFSDGSRLTVEDVYASYEAAKVSDYYKGRFQYYVEAFRIEDGALVFYLTTPFENLAPLLDIPIVRAEDVDAEKPLGTGPYALSDGLSGLYLRKIENWWAGLEIAATAPTISLVEANSEAEVRDLFEFGDVSVVCTNPLNDNYADYRCDFELWDVNSGMFLYLGCNVLYSDYFDDGYLRTVLTYAIDREYIIDRYYHGHAMKATLAAPPNSAHYSQSLAAKYDYDSLKFIDAISSWQVPRDPENPDRKLRLLVNCDDSARLRTARYIAAQLTEYGIPCGTLEYGATTKPTYETVLRANTFDLYLGQTRLPPNMDLSEFFRLWGNLSWGGIPNDNILKMCKETLANSGNYYNLLEMLAQDGRIIPLLFGSYAVYAKRGLIPELNPARDNVFFYTRGTTMQSARIDTNAN